MILKQMTFTHTKSSKLKLLLTLISRQARNIFLALLLLAVSISCTSKTDDPSQSLEEFYYYFGEPNAPNSKSKIALLEAINDADNEIVAAFSYLDDVDVADALITAHQRGVKVSVAFDRQNTDPEYDNPCLAVDVTADIRNSGFLRLRDQGDSVFNESDEALKEGKIVLHANRRKISDQYDSRCEDGKMESNFLVADSFTCWVSTNGAGAKVFSETPSEYSIAFLIKSRAICEDFYREGNQLANGGLFSDEGVASFGDIQYNKAVTDGYTKFSLKGHIFHIYFGSQERPINPIITTLLNSHYSIRFAARSLSQDLINNVEDSSENRSHILNIFQYKHYANDLFEDANFTLQGIIGADPYLTEGTPDNAAYFYDDGNPTVKAQNLDISIHSDLSAILGEDLRKYNEGLQFNLFLIDENTELEKVIIVSDDLRKRFFNDTITDGIYDWDTYADYFNVTDSVTIMIEKEYNGVDRYLFQEFQEFYEKIFNEGGSF